MRFQCSFCDVIFSSERPPTECPKCNGKGKARFGQRRPTKLTHRQRRAIAKLDPELVRAYREAHATATPSARVQVKVVPEQPGKTQPLTRELVREMSKLISAGEAQQRDDVRPDAVSPESLVFGECTIKV